MLVLLLSVCVCGMYQGRACLLQGCVWACVTTSTPCFMPGGSEQGGRTLRGPCRVCAACHCIIREDPGKSFFRVTSSSTHCDCLFGWTGRGAHGGCPDCFGCLVLLGPQWACLVTAVLCCGHLPIQVYATTRHGIWGVFTDSSDAAFFRCADAMVVGLTASQPRCCHPCCARMYAALFGWGLLAQLEMFGPATNSQPHVGAHAVCASHHCGVLTGPAAHSVCRPPPLPEREKQKELMLSSMTTAREPHSLWGAVERALCLVSVCERLPRQLQAALRGCCVRPVCVVRGSSTLPKMGCLLFVCNSPHPLH